MANVDYRVSISWRHHPKRIKLQRKLGVEGVLAMTDLWSAVAELRPTGILDRWDKEDVEIQAGWQGNNGSFVDVLLDLRLLDFDNKTKAYAIHNWLKWNGWAATAPVRSAMARKAAAARWERKGAKKSPNAAHENEQCNTDEESNTPPPHPSPSPVPEPPPVPVTINADGEAGGEVGDLDEESGELLRLHHQFQTHAGWKSWDLWSHRLIGRLRAQGVLGRDRDDLVALREMEAEKQRRMERMMDEKNEQEKLNKRIAEEEDKLFGEYQNLPPTKKKEVETQAARIGTPGGPAWKSSIAFVMRKISQAPCVPSTAGAILKQSSAVTSVMGG